MASECTCRVELSSGYGITGTIVKCEHCSSLPERLRQAEAEITRLKVSSGVEKMNALMRTCADLKASNERLLSGKWTPEEINNICHNLHGTVSAEEFAQGCIVEQRNIYKCAPTADLLAKTERDLTAAIVARDLNHEQWKLREAELEDLKASNEALREACDSALNYFDDRSLIAIKLRAALR